MMRVPKFPRYGPQNGSTPAYAAAINGHAEALAVLRDGGANLETPNKVTSPTSTVLHVA